jgi:hypothetical protein
VKRKSPVILLPGLSVKPCSFVSAGGAFPARVREVE